MQKRLFLILALLVFVLPFAAFAQEATPEMEMMEEVEPIELPEVDALSYDGEIIIAGSSTVFPVAEVAVEAFQSAGFPGDITLSSIGSGAGLERFCVAGETDVANASRAINDGEVEACGQLDPARTPIELYIGIDALAVAVSSANDFVTELTIDQLARIFGGEYTTWADVDASYPAEAIQLYSPGTDSGTYDFFVEEVMEEIYGDEGPARILEAPGIQFSEDDNVLVQGVEGSPYAIGYFGFAYYTENEEALTALNIEGIEPNAETAESGEYPLSRPLFMYTDAGILAAKPQVYAYLNFVLTNANEFALAVGYFPTSVENLNTAKTALLEAAVGAGLVEGM